MTYLNETLKSGKPGSPARRSDLVRLGQRAQTVLNQLGAAFVWQSSPATGGEVFHGLANTMFVHETPFGGASGLFNWPSSYQGIIDVVDLSLSRLEELDAEIRSRRRNPLYWGDRILRALLGFPAYLLGLIFGVPASRIEESPYGTALRVAAFIVELGVLLLGLNEIVHWV